MTSLDLGDMCLGDLVQSAPHFSSLGDLCYLKGSKTGLAAPYARLSGGCLKENPGRCRDSGVYPKKQGRLLFPVVWTSYLCFKEHNLSPVPVAVLLHC